MIARSCASLETSSVPVIPVSGAMENLEALPHGAFGKMK